MLNCEKISGVSLQTVKVCCLGCWKARESGCYIACQLQKISRKLWESNNRGRPVGSNWLVGFSWTLGQTNGFSPCSAAKNAGTLQSAFFEMPKQLGNSDFSASDRWAQVPRHSRALTDPKTFSGTVGKIMKKTSSTVVSLPFFWTCWFRYWFLLSAPNPTTKNSWEEVSHKRPQSCSSFDGAGNWGWKDQAGGPRTSTCWIDIDWSNTRNSTG